jgi:hypothetical protein
MMAAMATDKGSSPSASKSRKAVGSKRSARAAGAGETWNGKMLAHRRRQASVAAILDRTFGQLAKCSPNLWERRAYLMLIGLVYERLATNEEEISTDELVSLAKVLAENRRAEARLREHPQPTDSAEPASPPTGELPERFTDVVRQVYGTNLQVPTGPDGKGD